MQGIPMDAVRAVREATSRRRVVAAGGITTQEEIDELDAMGVDAVVGMAIYTGRLAIQRRRLTNPRPPAATIARCRSRRPASGSKRCPRRRCARRRTSCRICSRPACTAAPRLDSLRLCRTAKQRATGTRSARRSTRRPDRARGPRRVRSPHRRQRSAGVRIPPQRPASRRSVQGDGAAVASRSRHCRSPRVRRLERQAGERSDPAARPRHQRGGRRGARLLRKARLHVSPAASPTTPSTPTAARPPTRFSTSSCRDARSVRLQPDRGRHRAVCGGRLPSVRYSPYPLRDLA